jgi:hypothetical protein
VGSLSHGGTQIITVTVTGLPSPGTATLLVHTHWRLEVEVWPDSARTARAAGIVDRGSGGQRAGEFGV